MSSVGRYQDMSTAFLRTMQPTLSIARNGGTILAI
jgi:hypothetical protein